jgi:hypothetical protein
VLGVAVSEDARCVAAATASELRVFDEKGQPSWHVTLANAADWRSPEAVVAVSPDCGWGVVAAHGPDATVSIARSDGTSVRAALTPEDAHYVRSLAISPDAKLAVVGTDRDVAVVLTRDGAAKGIEVSSLGEPVHARFTPDSRRILVSAYYVAGVVELDGRWLWHLDIEFMRIAPDRKMTWFAGMFVTAHGPQHGTIGAVDANGRVLWKMDRWEPAVAMAPSGAYMVASFVPFEWKHPDDVPPDVFDAGVARVITKSRRALAKADVHGVVEGVSADTTCIAFIERESRADSPRLVIRDMQLREAWTVPRPNGLYGRPVVAQGAPLLFVLQREQLTAYAFARCDRPGRQ